ncbi:hypothetical protein QMO14_16885 [Variovorax sp. CAN2819]|uniref:hypothetical protein n=1 Tax=Variovorax sp. CAN15 TaxID=3046727 RepID=UPI002647E710|nr:hypothetical protein [Variovorax sp. CAN15]MDN6885283.1 hypothetical protein [Variovorax sp. CAN15]
MADLFSDDFEGASGSLSGRVTDGLAWDVLGSVDLDGAGAISSFGGSCAITIPEARFSASEWVEVEFGFTNLSSGRLRTRFCTPASQGNTNPGNPGCLAEFDLYYNAGTSLIADDNAVNLQDYLTSPTSGVAVMRFTPGSPTVLLHVNGVLIGTADTTGSVPMGAITGDMVVRFEFLFGPTVTSLVVRDQSGGAGPSPFWTAFANTFEVA